MVKHRSRATTVEILPDAGSVVSHAGALMLQGLCDKLGVTDALLWAFAPPSPQTIHRGCVMRDLAVAIADGGDAVVAVEWLRVQGAVFGPVASDTTVWRALGELTEARRHEFRMALAAGREKAWAQSRVRICRLLCLDVDATLVTAHSDKELAAGNYKKGFGFHPVVCSLDATREVLGVLQRPGNAGANCADDLLETLELGLGQLPAQAFDEKRHDLVVRMDSAGQSHQVVDYCLSHGLGFVIGADLTTDVWLKIGQLEEDAWVPAIDQDGHERDYAHVAELSAPDGWGEGVRMLARREIAHIGAPMRLLDHEGNRYQIIITSLDETDLAYIAALYNGRGRAEQAIDELKRCGLGKLPAQAAELNEAWILASLLAHSLVRWSQMLLLDGSWAIARIDTIRNVLLHTGARITRHARRLRMHLDTRWPAYQPLTTAFTRLRAMRTPVLQPC